jgi:glycosyltransferase involved in cell wall biosynthesis
VVATVHGFVRGSWKGRLYEWMQRRAYRHFSAVAAVSKPQVTELLAAGVPRGRVHLLPNAWSAVSPPLSREEARARLRLPPEPFVIGWVGRLSREKGADVLLDAVAALRDLPVEVSIIGDGRQKAALQAQAEMLGIEDRIRWHGLLSEAWPCFPAFDCFVLSSRTEGTPIALFEAMEAGVPIVATMVGGVPDVVSTGEALLVPSESPACLAEAIRSIRSEPAEARLRAAEAAARLRREFSAAPWLQRYENIYRSLHRTPAGIE